MTRREKAQEKEGNDLAGLAERLRVDREVQKDIIKASELIITAQRETIELQRRQLALQAGIFARMFNSTAQWQQQMQNMLQAIPPAKA